MGFGKNVFLVTLLVTLLVFDGIKCVVCAKFEVPNWHIFEGSRGMLWDLEKNISFQALTLLGAGPQLVLRDIDIFQASRGTL